MVGTPRHYYVSLAVFFVALSLTFYLVREEQWVVHDKIGKTSYTCPAPTEECATCVRNQCNPDSLQIP